VCRNSLIIRKHLWKSRNIWERKDSNNLRKKGLQQFGKERIATITVTNKFRVYALGTGGKARRWPYAPPSSEVKERVELYLYLLCASWHCTRCTRPFFFYILLMNSGNSHCSSAQNIPSCRLFIYPRNKIHSNKLQRNLFGHHPTVFARQ
jgi:hypothetical protein